MRTRAGICQRKRRFVSEDEALGAVAGASIRLRPYRCELCRQYHLTSRTKGLRTPLFERQRQS